MQISKNKKYQYSFFIIVFFNSLLNGGNSNIAIQINFILMVGLFLFSKQDKNYNIHLIKKLNENKTAIFFYIFFLLFLLFQIIPIELEFLKYFSKTKYLFLKKLELDGNYFSISLSPSNTFFQFLNYMTILFITLCMSMIFYNKSHIFRFYYFISFLGAFHSALGVYFYLIGNPDFLFIKNSIYEKSSTGFFINRTVFSIFLLLCLFASLEYLKNIEKYFPKNKDNFYNKIYIRIFVIFISIGIITSLSKLGNFLFLLIVIFYLFNSFLNSQKNTFFKYTLILIILFDVLILGTFFGIDKLVDRFSFLTNEFTPNNLQDSNLRRIFLIKFSIAQIKDFFYFGYGAGAFENLFYLNFNNIDNRYASHAHSSLSEFFGEFGLFGSSFLLISFFNIFNFKYFKNFNITLLIFILSIVIIFDFSSHIPSVQILFICLFYNFFRLNKSKFI